MSLARFDNDGIELIINTATGESFASVSGYARMSGKNKSTISRRLESVAESLVNTVEMETAQGKSKLRLISEDLIVTWLPKDNPEMATKMMKAGVRMFLHTLAGFNVTSTAVQPEVKQQLPLRHSTIEYVEATQKVLGFKGQIPEAMRQVLMDNLADELLTTQQQKALPEVNKPRLVGAAQRAEELGFPVNIHNRGQLGKFIKQQGLIGSREKRLCNGQLREINVYEDCSELDTAIALYFS